jgi:hypothetical protein
MARNQAAAANTALAPAKPDDPIVQAIESALEHYGIRSISALGKVQQMIRMAEGIRALRAAITNEFVVSTIVPLYGTPLGFLADRPNDKQPQPYSIEVIKDCVIEGLIRGFNVVGNEMNIIGGRFYGTKNGFERQVSEYPGLTDLVMQPGVPAFGQQDTQNARVPFTASWRLQGKAMKLECHASKDGPDNRIPVRVNAGMGLDAVIGKAYRKMYYRIYGMLHGSTFGLLDGDVSEPIDTVGTPAPLPETAASKQTGRSQGAALDELAKKGGKAKSEPPPAQAPANDASEQLTIERVRQVLAEADAGWASLSERTATDIINEWTNAQTRKAYAWAVAFLKTGKDEAPPEQPEFTFIGRQPGEEG